MSLEGDDEHAEDIKVNVAALQKTREIVHMENINNKSVTLTKSGLKGNSSNKDENDKSPTSFSIVLLLLMQ